MRYRLECPANRYVFKSRLNCSESNKISAQSCPWVRFLRSDTTQPGNWVTQPNPTRGSTQPMDNSEFGSTRHIVHQQHTSKLQDRKDVYAVTRSTHTIYSCDSRRLLGSYFQNRTGRRNACLYTKITNFNKWPRVWNVAANLLTCMPSSLVINKYSWQYLWCSHHHRPIHMYSRCRYYLLFTSYQDV